jgi:hypothetical protein
VHIYVHMKKVVETTLMHFKDTIEETCRINASTHLAMMFVKD